MKLEEAEGEKPEMSYEQYVAIYADHIEGKAPNHRQPASSSDDEFPVGGSPVKRARSKKPTTPKVDPKKKDEEDSKSQSQANMTKTATEFSEIKKLKWQVPESCLIPFSKKLKIEKLDCGYRLCMHPFPLVEGEMILFQPNLDD